MHTRNAAALVLALATVSGCAAVRPRWLGGGSLGAPVKIPQNAVPMGEFVRGEAALQQNDIDTATDAFEKAVHADPTRSMLRLRLATLYVRNGKLEKAREQCERVVAAEPDNMDAPALPAGIDSALNRDDDAIAIYERVLAHDPDVQEAYLYLGALYGKRGQVDQAIARCSVSSRATPNSLSATTTRGASTRRRGSSIRRRSTISRPLQPAVRAGAHRPGRGLRASGPSEEGRGALRAHPGAGSAERRGAAPARRALRRPEAA
jgi:tetratricopeptide (TPR) repeat protein